MVSEENIIVARSKHVCLIGAGPSGLVVARELRKEGHNVVVLEQNHDVGGQWLYEPNVEGQDPLGNWTSSNPDKHFLEVHSSIYASLRLMSAREIIGYSDFPFVVKKGRDARRFPCHEELYMYLRDFSERFEIRPMIRFNTRVEYVGMLDCDEAGKDIQWVVRSREKKTAEVVEEVFDAVVVATGHYSHPRKPSNIKGMDAWKRKQLHSHIYRVPDPFRGEVVVVIGNSFSGRDISMELVNVAKQVYLSSKSTDNISQGLSKVISKHPNLHLSPQVESLGEDGRVTFMDGSTVIADTILYCTGYSYCFPFLDTKGTVRVDDDRVGPLFEHTFPPSLAPSLSFVGIPRRLLGLPFFESQGKWIAQLLAGKKTLPTYEEMMQSIKAFYDAKDAAGIPKHMTHDLGFDTFQYCDKYADYSEFPRVQEWRKSLCISYIMKAEADLETYRDSLEGEEELLREAFQSPYFTQLGRDLDLTLEAYGFTSLKQNNE